jgi:hypothetical protein
MKAFQREREGNAGPMHYHCTAKNKGSATRKEKTVQAQCTIIAPRKMKVVQHEKRRHWMFGALPLHRDRT